MQLTLDGKRISSDARPEDARGVLERLQRARRGELELKDGARTMSLQLAAGVWFLEAGEGSTLRYGMLVTPLQAVGALNAFLKGGLPMPDGWGAGAAAAEGFESVVVGDAAHPDCPLCRMMGVQ
ncbi:MAG: hypothetical protein HY928_17475 [Elusimicrobia bacterium]|nr:hypothetical protein [Elusimicrobiota bacterium]